MKNAPRAANENRILAALPPADRERLAPYLQAVELPQGQVLYRAGEHIEQVYFPTDAVTCFVAQMRDGGRVEVGVTGFEGMAGLSLILGVGQSPHESMVQIQGGALRLRGQVLLDEFKRGGALHDMLLRYTQSLLLQTSQVAACNRVHSVAERLARWLLMSHDRCACDDLPLTQEFLSIMLGTRRAGVTEAAIVLQADGLIRYSRGHIAILDREGLMEFSCECYAIIKEEFDLLLRSHASESA